MINKKKSITLLNRTNYYDPLRSKEYVTFGSSRTYQSQMIKREGYESRLYWQYKYCEDNGGQTFFYTLTYNNSSIPKFYGRSCFDYEDLRDLLTGGFRKKLLRRYGTTFKYFVGAELGEGAGERGLHNNPHYHILFFLESANSSKYPYVVIDPVEFRSLVREYWQGFDQDKTPRSYQTCKYGIVKEGKFNLGKVDDFRAVQYVSKYVTKDVGLVAFEKDIERKVRLQYRKKSMYDVYSEFFKTYIDKEFNVGKMSERELVSYLLPGYEFLVEDYINYEEVSKKIIDKYNLVSEFSAFISMSEDREVYNTILEYRNRYCNKCRISHNVGEYALKFIDSKDPYIAVPSKKGIKRRPINLYYYRKLYTDVVKDKKGQNCYVLNNIGIEYKLSRMSYQIDKKKESALGYLSILESERGRELYNKIKSSDCNNTVFMGYDDFINYINKVDINKIINRYGEYKVVYEGRNFRMDKFNNIPVISVYDDYEWFLQPTIMDVPYITRGVSWYNQFFGQDYIPYSSHPYFSQDIGIFAVFDMCSDYFFVQNDNQKEREERERREVKNYHRDREMKAYYSRFGIS